MGKESSFMMFFTDNIDCSVLAVNTQIEKGEFSFLSRIIIFFNGGIADINRVSQIV